MLEWESDLALQLPAALLNDRDWWCNSIPFGVRRAAVFKTAKNHLLLKSSMSSLSGWGWVGWGWEGW